MRSFLIFGFLLLSFASSAQLFYQDIASTLAIETKMKNLLSANVKSIVATGFDQQGIKTNEFSEWHKVDAANKTLTITTRNQQNFSTVQYRFNEKTKLVKTRDSLGYLQIISTFSYDDKDNLISIKTITSDTLQKFTTSEEHKWNYNKQNKPERMWKIVNEKDSTEYRFVLDEFGNVAEEKLFRRGVEGEFIYYYYNDRNLMTDVVRYNKPLMSLVPDMIFEYDERGNIIQKITPVSFKNPNYLIWRYLFNEKGLITKEALYNKNKQRTGTIEYQYSFTQ